MRPLLLCLLELALLVPAAGAAPAPLPPRPHGWPSTLQVGLADPPGGAAALRRSARFGLRYQYLAGGVNTGEGWATWNADGAFVTRYVEESTRAGVVPFFPYYMLRQSLPGKNVDDEARADLGNLADDETRQALLADLELFFRRAGAFRGKTVVLQLEPDLWGYVQQAARGDDAATVPHAKEFAQDVAALRDRLAPNVLLAYHLSIWGTKVDVAIADPPDRELDALAARAAAFYRSLGVRFDLATAEFSDRDAAFKQRIQGAGAWAWWKPADFRRHARFVGRFSRLARLRVALWQIPLGNTRMRAMNNEWGHYQDNRVEWLLGDASGAHLRAYADAGVIGLLFGGGAAGTTCACDAAKDGATNPAPIGANTRRSLSPDDDGGYFRDRVRAYYRRGPLTLAR
jgi:hypothetical protein